MDRCIRSLHDIITKLDTEDLIIGGDINAKSTWWGCEADDFRGKAYVDFIAQLDLNILNIGNTPTFYTYRSSTLFTSIVDVTACSNSVLNMITDWRVDVNSSLSDHRRIQFNLEVTREKTTQTPRSTTRTYNTRKANWNKFATTFKTNLEKESLTLQNVNIATTSESIEDLVVRYTRAILMACEESIPLIPKEKLIKKSKWWTAELTEQKKLLKKIRNRIRNANPRRKSLVVEEYTKAKASYKAAIEKAVSSSWKNFCSRQEKGNMWENFYRILKICCPQSYANLLCSERGDTLTPAESAQFLADTFYPLDDRQTDTQQQSEVRLEVEALVQDLKSAATEHQFLLFTAGELDAVFARISPGKAPGKDGLTSDICEAAYKCNPEITLALFNTCLKIGHFPRIWKIAEIRVMPKPGRDNYTKPKSYRPIGLLPVMGKILEKLVVNRLTWFLGHTNKLSPRQYGFMPQRSTEDALYDAVSLVRRSLQRKEIVVMVSLDIEGAFDNAWWPAILKELHRSKMDKTLLRLISSYLSDRSISLTYMGHEVCRQTNKGCIQGSTCGPLLWNVQLNPLLEQSSWLDAHVQAFADDILIIASGTNAQVVESKMNKALDIVSSWGKKHKMSFAVQKTQAIIITRKHKSDAPHIKLSGVPLVYSDTLKVLGLTIDRTLSFKPHIANVCQKAINIYKMVAKAVKTNWGLSPDITRTIYFAVVEPVILYAASVWAPVAERKYAIKRMDSLTRMFCIKITRAHRTTSFVSSALLARVLPLHLRIREQADLYKVKRGKPLDCLPGRKLEKRTNPFHLSHPAERISITYQHISCLDELESIGNNWMKIYTDGSKLEGDKVGAAVTCWQAGKEVHNITCKLESYNSVYQAELVAILQAVLYLKEKQTNGNILSDSRSALDALCSSTPEHPLVTEIQEHAKQVSQKNLIINFYWIKAHIGLVGNERADELAKGAALLDQGIVFYDKFPISYAKRLIRYKSVQTWQQIYSEAPTGSVTKTFLPEVGAAYKILSRLNLSNIKTQLLTGHCGIRSYLFRFRLTGSPTCSCDDTSEETIVHILTTCPRFGAQRLDCEFKLGFQLTKDNLRTAMEDDNCRIHFLAFAEKSLKMAAKANGAVAL